MMVAMLTSCWVSLIITLFLFWFSWYHNRMMDKQCEERRGLMQSLIEIAQRGPIIMGSGPSQERRRDQEVPDWVEAGFESDVDYLEALEMAQNQTSSVEEVEGA